MTGKRTRRREFLEATGAWLRTYRSCKRCSRSQTCGWCGRKLMASAARAQQRENGLIAESLPTAADTETGQPTTSHASTALHGALRRPSVRDAHLSSRFREEAVAKNAVPSQSDS